MQLFLIEAALAASCNSLPELYLFPDPSQSLLQFINFLHGLSDGLQQPFCAAPWLCSSRISKSVFVYQFWLSCCLQSPHAFWGRRLPSCFSLWKRDLHPWGILCVCPRIVLLTIQKAPDACLVCKILDPLLLV